MIAIKMELLRKYGMLKGLWYGIGPTMAREVPQFAVYYPIYECSCSLLSEAENHGDKSQLNAWKIFASGACAGVGCWVLTYPIDVVKTRIQAAPPGAYKNMFDAGVCIYQQGGCRSFFNGLMPTIYRAAALHSAIFLVYERALDSIQNVTRNKDDIYSSVGTTEVLILQKFIKNSPQTSKAASQWRQSKAHGFQIVNCALFLFLLDVLLANTIFRRTPIREWFEARIDEAREAKHICVYYDGYDIKANEMYEIKLSIPIFDPLSMGTIDVSQKSIEFQAPQFFSNLSKYARPKITVALIEAPLAYKSAGENFERMFDELRDQWRAHVMTMVKQGMSFNKIDPNKRIGSEPMHAVVGCLQNHLQSGDATKELEKSLKAIKL